MSVLLWLLMLAACGWLMIRQMFRWWKDKTPVGSSGYEKKQEAGGWRFIVTPNQDTMKYRGSQVLMFIIAFPLGFQLFFSGLGMIAEAIAGTGSPSDKTLVTVMFIILPIFAIWLTCATRYFLRRSSNKIIQSKASTFLVNQDSITIDGKKFHRDEIARLTRQNIVSAGEFSSPNNVAIAPNDLRSAAAGTFASMQSSAKAYKRERLRLIGFMVMFESGGNAHFLATALNEPQAFGLMKEVGDILGFTVK